MKKAILFAVCAFGITATASAQNSSKQGVRDMPVESRTTRVAPISNVEAAPASQVTQPAQQTAVVAPKVQERAAAPKQANRTVSEAKIRRRGGAANHAGH